MNDGGGPAALIEIDGLFVRRIRETLLDNVACNVLRGTIHVIVGPNGAGKSTLLSAILGQTAFSGRVAMNWRGTGAIGYVPQSLVVDPTLPVTVADFLALTRQRRPVCLGLTRAARTAVGALLERVGLNGLERRPLAVLSGGELRRVMLAHALEPEPELLVLDEPSAGLDESANRILEDLLVAARRSGRTTILMVSHDLDQVRRVADRITVLDRRVVADGTADLLAATSIRDLLPAARERRAVRA
jgi:zinc transport system ATP-binding protein